MIETYHGVDHLAEAGGFMQKENPCIEKVIPAERLEQMDFSQWELDEELYEKPCSRDTAILVLSGGSTGIPKLIARPHADYLHLQKCCALSCGMDENSVQSDRHACDTLLESVRPRAVGLFVCRGQKPSCAREWKCR